MRDILAVIGLIVVMTSVNKFCVKHDVSGKLIKIEKFVEAKLN